MNGLMWYTSIIVATCSNADVQYMHNKGING